MTARQELFRPILIRCEDKWPFKLLTLKRGLWHKDAYTDGNKLVKDTLDITNQHAIKAYRRLYRRVLKQISKKHVLRN